MSINATIVANRALQRVGAKLINISGGSTLWTDTGNNANQVRALYDIVRMAELRRSVWRFATRRAALRPLTSTTQLIAPAQWAVGTTYAQGMIVADVFGGYWQSIVAGNIGNVLQDDSSQWARYYGNLTADTYNSATSYYAGEIVFVSTTAYLSLASANIGNTPSSGAPWLSLGNILAPLTFRSPVGFGPLATSASKNIYRLPNGFLRLAAQDQKSASVSVLPISGQIRYSDWELEGDYLISSSAGPFIMRYVADISNPASFDGLFIEGFSARMAFELSEPLTQDLHLVQTTYTIYQAVMAEARRVNAIEIGSSEKEEMEYQPLFPAPGGMILAPQQSRMPSTGDNDNG